MKKIVIAITLFSLLLSACGSTSEPMDSSSNNALESSEKIENENSEGLTYTYVSMPKDTEEQKLKVIATRFFMQETKISMPKPQNIENFFIDPAYMYATLLYKKSDLKDIKKWLKETKLCDIMNKKEIKEYNFPFLKDERNLGWYNYEGEIILGGETIAGYCYNEVDGEGLHTTATGDLLIVDCGLDDYYRMYVCHQTGLPDYLIDHPECYGE